MKSCITRKEILAIGGITYFVLLVFAFIFYKERVIFTDSAFHLFSILKDKKFAIQHNRFGTIITQSFPLICAKLNLSLKTIVVIYSICFILFYSSVFIVLIQGFKSKQLALTYLLLSTLMATHSFYWFQSELPQGLAIFFVYLGFLQQAMKQDIVPRYHYWLSFGLLLTVCFIHPLLVFACSFVLLFLILSYPNKQKLITYNLLVYLALYAVKLKFFRTWYDRQAMTSVKNIFKLLPQFFELKSTKNLGSYLLHDYYFLIPCLMIVTIYYFIKKKWLKLLLINGYSFGYLIIVNVSCAHGADQFYIENQYSLLALFVCLPLAFDILLNYNRVSLMFIALVVSVGLWRMYKTHDFYTNRLDWERNIIAKTNHLRHQKIIISGNIVPQDKLLMTWGSSYEFWLLSTLENNQSRSIIVEEKKNEFDWSMNKNKAFLTQWGAFDYKDLDKRYFKFSDTSFYIKMDTIQ